MAENPEAPIQKSGGLDPEVEEFEYKQVQWKELLTKPKYIPLWILTIVITVLSVLITIHHDSIVKALRPTSEKIRDIPGGFVIPVAILIVISFPPLFGHELIALLCGVVWGLWIGFAIVAAGTFLGEIGTWYAFKYLFRKKAVKLERTNLNYGALARLTRDGGFLVVLIVRFSVIPSHFSTAVFSTCNVKFWHFAVATFLTLPKQITLVYFGVLLAQESNNNTIQDIVLGITFILTIVAGAYIYMKMRKTKKLLLDEQAARIDAKEALLRTTSGVGVNSDLNLSQRQEEGVYWRAEDTFARPQMAGRGQTAYEMDEMRRPRARMQEFV